MKKKSVAADMLGLLTRKGGEPAWEPHPVPSFTAKIEMEIDGEQYGNWEYFLFNYQDVFDDLYIGGWAKLVDEDEVLGMLIADIDLDAVEDKKDFKAAIKAWKCGKPVPEFFWVINKEVARRAFLEGVKACGMKWQESDLVDGPFMDRLIQIALFGSVQYG